MSAFIEVLVGSLKIIFNADIVQLPGYVVTWS